MNSIQLLSNKEAEFFISFELIKNFEIITFLTYKFGAYDELTDTIVISKFFVMFCIQFKFCG
jgi:hypothetical protein